MRILQKNSGYIKGFTLIELLITIAIVGIVVSIGVPSFTATIRNSRLTTNVNELVTSLNIARSEAIKRGQPVTVAKTDTEWEEGWNIFTDLNGDGGIDVGDGDTVLKLYKTLPNQYTLRASGINRITYRPTGISGNGSFVLCDNSDANNTPEAHTSRVVIINSVGRVRMGLDSDNNGIPEMSVSGTATNITSCTTSPFTS